MWKPTASAAQDSPAQEAYLKFVWRYLLGGEGHPPPGLRDPFAHTPPSGPPDAIAVLRPSVDHALFSGRLLLVEARTGSGLTTWLRLAPTRWLQQDEQVLIVQITAAEAAAAGVDCLGERILGERIFSAYWQSYPATRDFGSLLDFVLTASWASAAPANQTDRQRPPAAEADGAWQQWRHQLRDQIYAGFNSAELQELCYLLQDAKGEPDYESLKGGTMLAKIMELILWFRRRERLEILLTELRKARPKKHWPDPPQDPQLSSDPTASAHQGSLTSNHRIASPAHAPAYGRVRVLLDARPVNSPDQLNAWVRDAGSLIDRFHDRVDVTLFVSHCLTGAGAVLPWAVDPRVTSCAMPPWRAAELGELLRRRLAAVESTVDRGLNSQSLDEQNWATNIDRRILRDDARREFVNTVISSALQVYDVLSTELPDAPVHVLSLAHLLLDVVAGNRPDLGLSFPVDLAALRQVCAGYWRYLMAEEDRYARFSRS